jgi:hypothetical protein
MHCSKVLKAQSGAPLLPGLLPLPLVQYRALKKDS